MELLEQERVRSEGESPIPNLRPPRSDIGRGDLKGGRGRVVGGGMLKLQGLRHMGAKVPGGQGGNHSSDEPTGWSSTSDAKSRTADST